jgi:uncharacterized peroxidase-related enzyme
MSAIHAENLDSPQFSHSVGREPVSRFAVPQEEDLPEQVRKIHAKYRAQYGFVPNWLAALSVNPDTAYRLVVFYEHLFDPRLSRLRAEDRELIAVVSSAINECSYCVFNHTHSLGHAIGDRIRAQRIARDHHHVHLTEREEALADIAEKLSRKGTSVGETDFQRLRRVGFDEQAILEVLEISAFFAYANRLTAALSIVPDQQFFTA